MLVDRGVKAGVGTALARLALAAAWLFSLLRCSEHDAPGKQSEQALFFSRLHDMVYLPEADLLIERFEVTDGDFSDYVRATGLDLDQRSGLVAHWNSTPEGRRPARRTTPVRYLNLAEARDYAAFAGKAIPTRDEWYQALPGFEDGNFPWPRYVPSEQVSNVVETGLFEVTPVGVFEGGKSESGCYDLIGNVAEWTTTGIPAEDPNLCLAIGGSFNNHTWSPPGPRTEAISPGWAFGRPEELLVVDPWLKPGDQFGHDFRRVDERHFDVGVRCIVRNAEQVLNAAFDRVADLTGRGRDAAIQELLAVGERRGANRVLGLVAEREFRSRVLWQQPIGELLGLERSPAAISGGFFVRSEDFLVIRDDAVECRAGSDGRLLQAVALEDYSNTFPSFGVLPEAPGQAWVWLANSRGQFSLVHLPSCRRIDLSPLPDPEDQERLYLEPEVFAGDGRTMAVCAVQPFVERSWMDPSGSFEQDFVRVLSYTPGRTRELDLPGALFASRLCHPDRLLVSVGEDSFGKERFERQRHTLLDLTQLDVIAQRILEAAPDVEGVQPLPALSPTVPNHEGFLVCIGSRRTAAATVRLRVEYLSRFDLERLDTASFVFPLASRFLGSSLPLTYLITTPDGRPELLTVDEETGEIERVELSTPGTPRSPWRWWPSDALNKQAQPFLTPTLVRESASAPLLGLRRTGSGFRLDSLLAAEELDGAITSLLPAAAMDTRLVVLKRQGASAVLVDTENRCMLWREPLENASTWFLDALTPGAKDVLVGSSASGIWWRELETGSHLDGFAIRLGAIMDKVLVNVSGDSRREWLLRLRDRRVLGDTSPETGRVLVAIGTPTQEAALLLNDFQTAAASRKGE